MRTERNEKNKVIGCISTGLGETQIEVVVCERDGQDVAMLQLSSWHETLGWQVQKTIPFSADKIGQLQRLLSETRNHLEDLEAPGGAMARVIDLVARGPRAQASMAASHSTAQGDDLAIGAIS